MKNASAMYANAVPNIVEQTKNALIQSNLNYQKDLNEVAVVVAKTLAGREKEIGDGMAQVYANEFTEQELKDLVTFYKSPLGQKLLVSEPRAIQFSMSYMNQWAAALCRNREQPVPGRDEEARQGYLIENNRPGSVRSGSGDLSQAGLIWLSSTSICLSSVAVRAAFAPPASPPATAPRSWSPKNTEWAAPA